jgi:hypothetical protein
VVHLPGGARWSSPARPSFGYGRGKKLYRYYVSETLLPNGRIGHADNMRGERLSAERTERLLLDRLAGLLPKGHLPADLFSVIARIDCDADRLCVQIDAAALVRNVQLVDEVLTRARAIDPFAHIDGG